MTQEALRLALEALEAGELDMVDDGSGNMVFRKEQAITAIKEALAQPEHDTEAHYKGVIGDVQKLFDDKREAQPEQEPVAWVCMNNKKHDIDFDQPEIDAIPVGTMLYTHPPRTWVGLTDEEMQAVVDAQRLVSSINVYFKAIEAKLKEKNT